MGITAFDRELLEVFGDVATYTRVFDLQQITTFALIEEESAIVAEQLTTRNRNARLIASLAAVDIGDAQRGDTIQIGAAVYEVREVVKDDGALIQCVVKKVS